MFLNYSITLAESGAKMQNHTEYRKYDSTKTRVVPVFTAIPHSGSDWVSRLIKLPRYGATDFKDNSLDLTALNLHFYPNEYALSPAKSLLRWLIANPPEALKDIKDSPIDTTAWRRRQIAEKNQKVIDSALSALDAAKSPSGWYVFEGKS